MYFDSQELGKNIFKILIKNFKAQKARKDLNGEIFTINNGKKGKPVRICRNDTGGLGKQDPNKNLLIKNLDPSISARDFFVMFDEIGEVSSSKLEVDDLGVSKGFGYINYEDSKSAEAAIEQMVKVYFLI